jgi:hypothetical protein
MTKAERKIIYLTLLDYMNQDPMDEAVFPNLCFGLCYILREIICPKLGIIYNLNFIQYELPELYEEKPNRAILLDLAYWWKTGDLDVRKNAVKNALEKLERNQEHEEELV